MPTISQMSPQNAEFFQKKGFDISKDINDFQNIKDELMTPLIFVSGLKQQLARNIVKELIELRANVNLCSPDGTSALMMATMNERAKIVKLLLEHPLCLPVINPNIFKKNPFLEGAGDTPLTIIIHKIIYEEGSQKLVEMFDTLLDHKNIDINFDGNIGKTPLGVFCGNFIANDVEDEDDETGCIMILKKLIERGTDPNLKGFRGMQPILCILHHLIPGGLLPGSNDPNDVVSSEDAEQAISCLFKSAIDVKLDVYLTTGAFAYHTPLMIAQTLEIAELLSLILDEIRAQAIKFLKQLLQKDEDFKAIREKLAQFVEKHAVFTQNHHELYSHALKTLQDQVTTSVLALLNPVKTLGQLGISARTSSEIVKAGFDLNAGFDQQIDHITLFYETATCGLKDLFWALMVQQNYNLELQNKLLANLLVAVHLGNQSSIFQFLQMLGFEHMRYPFTYAVRIKQTEVIHFLLRVYETYVSSDNPKVLLFDQVKPNLTPILPQALQINQVPIHLLMKHFAQCLLRDTFAEESKQFKESTESKMSSEEAEVTKQEPLMTHKIKEVLLSRAQLYFGDAFQYHKVFVDETIKAICEHSDNIAKIMFNTGMHKTILFRYRAPIKSPEGIVVGLQAEVVKKRRGLPVDAIQCIFSYLGTHDFRKVEKIPFVFENIAIRKAIAFNPNSSALANAVSNKRPFEPSANTEYQSSQSADGKSSKKPKLSPSGS